MDQYLYFTRCTNTLSLIYLDFDSRPSEKFQIWIFFHFFSSSQVCEHFFESTLYLTLCLVAYVFTALIAVLPSDLPQRWAAESSGFVKHKPHWRNYEPHRCTYFSSYYYSRNEKCKATFFNQIGRKVAPRWYWLWCAWVRFDSPLKSVTRFKRFVDICSFWNDYGLSLFL